MLAQLTGLPIVPTAAAGSSDWRLDTWDRFRIPRPFGRCRFAYGPFLSVPRRMDEDEFESHRREVEDRLVALSREVEEGVRVRTTTEATTESAK